MELQVWRCEPCDVSWTAPVMKRCWSCGNRPTHVKPWRPSLVVGEANMHINGDLTKPA